MKYMSHTKIDNHKWSRTILSRIHEGMFWVGDILVMIDNDMIHRITSLCNEGCNLVSEKNAKKMVETSLKSKFDGRNMRIDLINRMDVRIINKIISYKMNHSSRVNFGLIHATYLMIIKREKVNMC